MHSLHSFESTPRTPIMNWNYLGDILEDTWLLQGLSVLGSFVLISVLVVLLARFDNTPILEWNGMSLNAVVALIATILKGLVALTISDCLGQAKWIWFSRQRQPLSDFAIIDQGSRGPFGSIKMLRKSVARSFIGFGAVLIILSVTMDSFVQLAVGKTNAVIYKNDSLTQISYARRYSKGDFKEATGYGMTKNDDVTSSDASASADVAMTSAVLSGLTQSYSVTAQQTKHNCLSGNCTWDTFQSLAVCSACIDLTNRLNRIIVPFIACSSQHVNLTVFRLSNGLGLTDTQTHESQYPLTWMAGFGTGNGSQSISFGSKDTLIWSMTMIRLSNPNAAWPSSPVTASECGLWYCVKNYDSLIKDGNLIEIESPAPSMKSKNSWHLDKFGLSEVRGKDKDTTLSFGISSIFNRTDLQLGDRFFVSQAAVYGISNLMNTTFTRAGYNDIVKADEVTFATCLNTSRYNTSVLVNGINAYFGSGNDRTIQNPTAMSYLYNSQDLNATFATLAKSMTNSIRENSDGNRTMTDKAGTLHVVYQVHWEYLILPIFLIVAHVVFLVIIIYYTRKSGLAVLCSSALPVLGFGGNIETVFNEIRLRSRMEEAAKFQQARFISVPKKKQNSDDVEGLTVLHEADGITVSHEGDGVTASQEGDGVTASQESDGVTVSQESDDVTPLHETDGHEMILIGAGAENQNNARRRSDEARSIISPISCDSRGA